MQIWNVSLLALYTTILALGLVSQEPELVVYLLRLLGIHPAAAVLPFHLLPASLDP